METKFDELLERIKQAALIRITQEGLGSIDGECQDISLYSVLFSELASEAVENLNTQDLDDLSDLLFGLGEELHEVVEGDSEE